LALAGGRGVESSLVSLSVHFLKHLHVFSVDRLPATERGTGVLCAFCPSSFTTPGFGKATHHLWMAANSSAEGEGWDKGMITLLCY